MLEDLVGGIGIPSVSIMGNMVDLESSVADLMQVGALSASLIGSVGNIVSALGNFGSVAGMLETMSTDSTERLRTVSRGTTVSYLNSSSSSFTTSNMNNSNINSSYYSNSNTSFTKYANTSQNSKPQRNSNMNKNNISHMKNRSPNSLNNTSFSLISFLVPLITQFKNVNSFT
jgi:hypothetical protein